MPGKLRPLFLLMLIFLAPPVFPAGGVLAGSSSPLNVIRTEFFDVIFPEVCRASAEKIVAVCDDYYIEITSLLETEAYQRFPVTITRSVEVLNAYYSAVPYNRIVLFDTLPEKNLDMYEETIQSVFYHELTHAVTYNMKAPALRRLSFFSGALSPAWLSVTTFWAEGATVSFESRGRGGRLNDPFSTQIVSQSVIEGRFPSWRDVTGARDTYPGGTDAYIFGSMFASYLQETYGMSRYADFWKKAGSSLSFSFVAGVFRKAYGMSVSEAWRDFERTLTVEHDEKNAAPLSDKKSRVATFDVHYDSQAGVTKIAFFDAASSALRLLTLGPDGKIKRSRKLLAVTGVTRVAFDADGRKIAISRNIDERNYKCVTAEYDLDRKKYTEHKESGRRDGYFKISGGKPEFACVSVRDFLDGDGEIPFSPVCIGENLGAAIIKDGLSWKIRLSGTDAPRDFDFSRIPSLPDSEDGGQRNLILHNLHSVSAGDSAVWLSFAWAELGKGGEMLSRAGFLRIDREAMSAAAFLQKRNGFAGAVEAVPSLEALQCLDAMISDSGNRADAQKSFAVFVTAAQYAETPLYRAEMTADDFDVVMIPAGGVAAENGLVQKTAAEAADDDNSGGSAVPGHSVISYNPFRYYRSGILVPLLAVVPVHKHSLESEENALAELFLGLTFVSTNPWGDRQVWLSAGYNPLFGTGGAYVAFSGGDDSFQYSASGTAVFDRRGFMQTAESVQVAKTMWRGKTGAFSVGAQGNFLYGRQLAGSGLPDIGGDSWKERDDSVGKSASALAFVKFSDIHKISPAVHDYAGFSLQPFVMGMYRDSENLGSADKYLNAGASAVVRFPVLVPLIFRAALFPSSKYAAEGGVTAILADFEIHKGIPAVSLFVQRVVVSAGYAGKIAYSHGGFWDICRADEIFRNIEKNDYSDAVRLSAELFLSPNTGFAADSAFQLSLGCSLAWRPNPDAGERQMSLALTAGFVY